MLFKSEFLLLTKSSKMGGLCVAGWIFDDQNKPKWMRLVENEYGDDIKKYKYFFDKANVLDLLKVEYKKTPLSIQTENCFLLKEPCFIRKFNFREFHFLCNSVENANLLYSVKRFLTEDQARQLNKSLMVVDVNNLQIFLYIYKQGEKRKKKTRANFVYNGQKYFDYSVTDQNFFYEKEISYSDSEPDSFKIKKDFFKQCKIILSIPQNPWDKDSLHHKFIAKIFDPNKYK